MSKFISSVRSLIDENGDGPVLVHSDIFRVMGAIEKTTNAAQMLKRHITALEQVTDGRAMYFPTFNYDFLRTGRYDVSNDPSQVGALSEYARTEWASWRSEMPVFNFSGKVPPSKIEERVECDGMEISPFCDNSFFGKLHRDKGIVLLYGASLNSLTGIHYIEHIFGQPQYRYDKFFPGSVLSLTGEMRQATLKYHVRPMGCHLEYDWKRLSDELENSGLLVPVTGAGAKAFLVRFPELCDYWGEKLLVDPLYLLDKQSRIWVEKKLFSLGRRFVIGDFEDEE